MKKCFLTMMIAALLILPLESVAVAKTPSATSPETSAQGEAYVPGDVPAQIGPAESMTPALHAMVMAMVNHGLSSYDPSNSQLGWETLYNMLSLYGQLDERSEYVGEDLLLPRETVQDYAAALPMAEVLGDLPDDLSDRMVYDSSSDSYRVICGNDSLAEIQVDQTTQADGAVHLAGRLVYVVDGSSLAQFQAVLQPTDSMFGYVIASMELL
ncbi:hypothetical protein [Flavonifractor sp. An100]|uniref:hypothetical protein n=1 Tax=Flavonifractor sp. An100 TaxID=1965538 RepID=UPI000B3AE593|nr:hypothetical protein [Flavonifractor sp. An100]OUQ78195.1 hypothetical protein B5E43_09075 [Flavonifractor sp. An100]